MQANPPVPRNEVPLLEASQANIRHYLHVVLERRWLAISTFLVFLVLTGIYLAQATPIYQAVARIQINRESENNPLNTGRDAIIDSDEKPPRPFSADLRPHHPRDRRIVRLADAARHLSGPVTTSFLDPRLAHA